MAFFLIRSAHRPPLQRLLGLLASVLISASAPVWSQGPASSDASSRPLDQVLGASTSVVPDQARDGPVAAQLLLAQTSVQPGGRLTAAVRLDHDPGWHTYWKNPGDSGLPTSLSWQLLPGPGLPPIALKADPIVWPAPKRIAVGPLANYGHEGRLLLGQTLSLPTELSELIRPLAAGQTVHIQVQVSWLVCREVCIPGGVNLSLPLRLTDQPETTVSSLVQDLAAQQPMPSTAAQGFAVSPDRQSIWIWGAGSPEGRRGGLVFPETPQLVSPSAAQALYRTSQGWLLALRLDDRSVAVLPKVLAEKRLLATWVGPQGQAEDWRLSLSKAPDPLNLLDAGQSAQAIAEAEAPKPAGVEGLAWALALALLGGLVLNLMPCVFPVLMLKVLALTHKYDPQASREQAGWFGAGVILSMLGLAGLLMALRASGESLGWGFQLQNPWVVLSLIAVFLALGLSLMGGFELGLGLTRLGRYDRGSGRLGALGSGVLTTVVASPCTGPFMGAALAYGLTAPVLEGLLVFAALGLGLAFPVMLLVVVPAMRRFLPKPGPWMNQLKVWAGVPMLVAAAWLAWVLQAQLPPFEQAPLALPAVVLVLVLWCLSLVVWGRHQRAQASKTLGRALPKVHLVLPRISLPLLSAVLLLAAVGMILLLADDLRLRAPGASGIPASSLGSQASPPPTADAADVVWKVWQPGLAEASVANGQVVVVDFTAAWCITCQANKLRVLSQEPVASRLAQPGVLALRADWTRQDPEITQALASFGRSGVPLYVVYGPKLSRPLVLSEWLSQEELMRAMDQAGSVRPQ